METVCSHSHPTKQKGSRLIADDEIPHYIIHEKGRGYVRKNESSIMKRFSYFGKFEGISAPMSAWSVNEIVEKTFV